MKQTKPFGRAFLPPADRNAPQPSGAPAPVETTEVADKLPPKSSAGAELFDLGGTHRVAAASPDMPWAQAAKNAAVYLSTVIVLMVVWVGMRDSMLLAKLLDVVPNEETVMLCKDGRVLYDDDADLFTMVTDRLLSRGHLICTDWRVQRGYLYRPARM